MVKQNLGSEKFADFIGEVFLSCSKANKRLLRQDEFRARTICEYFGGKTSREISPLSVEDFKRLRRKSITKRSRSVALRRVNRELELPSKILNLAIDDKQTDANPCGNVKKYTLDNNR